MKNRFVYCALLFYALLLFLCSACNKVVLPIDNKFNGPVKSVNYKEVTKYRYTFDDSSEDKEIQKTRKWTYEYDEDGLLTEQIYDHNNDYERYVYSYSKERNRTICQEIKFADETSHSTKIFDKNGKLIKDVDDDDPDNYWTFLYDYLGRECDASRYDNGDLAYRSTTTYNDEEESETLCEYDYDDNREKKLKRKIITYYKDGKTAHVERYSTENGKEYLEGTTTFSKDGTKSTEKEYYDDGRYTIIISEMDDYGNPLHKEKSYSYKDEIDITDYIWEYDSYGNVTYKRMDYYSGSVSYKGMHYEVHNTEYWDYDFYSEVEGNGKISTLGIIILIIIGFLMVIGIIWEIKHPSVDDKKENKTLIIIWVIFILIGGVSLYFDVTDGTRHSSESSYYVNENYDEGSGGSYSPSFRGTYNDKYKGKKCSQNKSDGHYCDCPGFISQHWDPSKCANCPHPASEHTR